MTLEAKTALALLAIIVGTYLFLLGQPGAKYGYPTTQINLVIIIGDTTMPFGIESIIGGIIGQGTDYWAKQEQMKDQWKLMREQEMASMRLGRYNQGLALEMWDKTNYPAQVEQMRKAGLNVGLIYKGGGAGGSTAVAPGTMPSASGAPRMQGMAIQTAMALEMQKAQIENIQADTEAKKATVPEIIARTGLLDIQTGNAKIDGEIKTWQNQLAALETQKAKATLPEAISIIKSGAEKLIEDVRTARNIAEVGEKSREAAISRIQSDATTAYLMAHFTQGQIIKQNVDIEVAREQARKIAAEIKNMKVIQDQGWDRLDLNERETIVKELAVRFQGQQTAFNTSTAAEFRQWMDAFMGGANLANSLKNFKK